MEKLLSDKKAIAFFVLPALLLFLLVVYYSVVQSGYYSLLSWDGIGKASFVGLKNYVNLFVNNTDGFTRAIYNSIILAVLTVGIQLPLALFFAIVLAKHIKGETFFRTAFFIPVTISTTVIGQLWLKIYHPSYGMLNVLLDSLGLNSLSRGWLGNTSTALIACFVPIVWQYVGYHMLLLYTSIKSIPDELFEAAYTDGATNLQIAFKIIIPLIRPMLQVCTVFSVVGSLKVFDLIYVLTNGGPAHASEVPSTLMFNTIFFRNQYGYGSAMSIFIFIECLVFTVIIQKFMKREDANS
ncbi:MAG TPA: sugar ABC transporter permease [Ruminiclostridium sp.]